MNNYRHELKFIISKNLALILKQKLNIAMNLDTNASKDGTYIIKSLYFDNYNSKAYYEKLDGTLYRRKYRIRIYNDDENFIRLEKKLKLNNMCCKKQAKISKKECLSIFEENYNINNENDLITEFINNIKLEGLKPSVIVEYKRTAFTYPISDVRITIDEELKSGLYNYDLFNKEKVLYNIYNNDEVVIEVKFNEILPEHIAIILKTVPMFRQAVSKFARCRSIK